MAKTKAAKPTSKVRKVTAKPARLPLDPEAPGLDEDTRARRRVLAEMRAMSPEQIFDLAVKVGIYKKNGKLTKAYGGELAEGRASGLSAFLRSARRAWLARGRFDARGRGFSSGGRWAVADSGSCGLRTRKPTARMASRLSLAANLKALLTSCLERELSVGADLLRGSAAARRSALG